MTINSDWVKKDFKQKYFLYCKDCILEIPQAGTASQSFKTTEKIDKVINITEIKK